MVYIWIIIAAVVTSADQFSKFLISAGFNKTDHITFIPGLIDIVYVENRGAAFSMLNEHTWFLGLISVLFCVAIIAYMLIKKPKNRMLVICAGLLLGGALGNGIDRLARSFVVDFIEITLFRFPVFNLADIAITAGAALLVLHIILSEKESKNGKDNSAV